VAFRGQVLLLDTWRGRERELEAGAFVRLGLDPDAAAVAVDDALDDGEPDARARKLTFGVQALKDTEEATGVFHVEAGAIVAHGTDEFVAARIAFHFDRRPFPLAGKFVGVGKEVDEDLFEKAKVPEAIRQFSQADVHLPALALGFELSAAILLGSLLASHTLLASSIIVKLGLTKLEPISVTYGATMFSDTSWSRVPSQNEAA